MTFLTLHDGSNGYPRYARTHARERCYTIVPSGRVRKRGSDVPTGCYRPYRKAGLS